MRVTEVSAKGLHFSIEREGREVGRAYLYILTNSLRDRPFGLLEDVYVEVTSRGSGVGGQLIKTVLTRAQVEGCYKLIATSRKDGTRQLVHDWYIRLGFRDYGIEFRMDF